MFNFGYLPKASKAITTLAESSRLALTKTLGLLSEKSLLTAICYPGHEQGKIETTAVEMVLSGLSTAEFTVEHYAAKSTRDEAPRMYVVSRKLNDK